MRRNDPAHGPDEVIPIFGIFVLVLFVLTVGCLALAWAQTYTPGYQWSQRVYVPSDR
jgi:hypothetical protein